MSTPNLLYTEVEEDLRGTVRRLLSDRCPPGEVTAVYDGERTLVAGLWKAVAADLGLAGLLVPEEDGGAGASAREAAVVMEEMGRAAAPLPYLTSAVVATTALLGSGTPLLADLAAGQRTAAVTVPLPTFPEGPLPTVPRGTDGRLTARIRSVAGALEADVLLVPVQSGNEKELVAVPADEATVTPIPSLDMTRQLADVSLDGVRAGSGSTVVAADQSELALRTALFAGAALLSSEQVGLARYSLESTIAYLKERRQFGRVVGGFQALKHRLADLYAAVESATAAARYAAATLADGDPDAHLAAAVAQAYCSEVAVRCAEEAIQLHGGIGMTWEHPAHLYLKRAKADQIAFGTSGAYRQLVGRLAGLPGPVEAVE